MTAVARPIDDDLQFLRDLQQELKTQDHDSQASPRFWVIGDYEEIPVPDGYGDKVRVHSYDGDRVCSLEMYLESLDRDELSEEALEELDAIDASDSDSERQRWFDRYSTDGSELFWYVDKFVIKQNTMFLTKAEAQQHLEQNRHHYSAKAHTYAMTAWRAQMVERLLSILETIDWSLIANLQKQHIKAAETLASWSCPPKVSQDNCPAGRGMACLLQTCTECWVGALERMGKGEGR